MKNDMTALAIVAVAVAALWLWSKNKPAQAASGSIPYSLTGIKKAPVSESASIPLDFWQSLTTQQLQGLPVTERTGQVGGETYYKTSSPVAIGNTGFKVWGMTESGSAIVSKNDPSTYDPIEWEFM